MRTILTVLLLLGPVPSAGAQTVWSLSAETGANRFSRAAHDTSTPAVSLGAWHATSYTVRLARGTARDEFALSAGYTASPFAAWIENVALLQEDELALFEFGLTYGRRVIRTGRGAALRLEGGPVLHLWTMSGEDARTRLGGLLGAVMELPLAERWRVDVRTDLTITRSWMRPEDET